MASWAGLQQAEVLAVLRDLSAAGCRVWVAGGWAVDVLVGRQTRSHRDLDLAVHAEDEAPTVRVLEDRGYRVETDWRPVRVELARPGGGWVDLHPVDFDDAGNGRQAQLEGGGFDYPRSAFTSGLLAGVEVACLSFAQQVAFRRGYELRPVDLHDLRALDARGPSATEGGPARIVDEATVTAGLPRLLAQAWEAAPLELTRSSGPVGMGSVTTGVTVQGIGAFVVKWVPEAAAGALDRGSAAAAELEQVGLSVGAALPTSGSRLSAPFHGGRAALLRRVDGHPLSGTAADQERMAQVLSRVHAARRPRASDDRYEDAALASASGVEPWVVPSVTAVRDEYGRLPALTWGLVHHDPAPEAFFHDAASGVTSLIDWTGAGDGPLLFDVASAVMYLGGRQRSRSFLDTYLRLASQSLQAEAAEHLGFLARLRGAVQAAYFSRR
ncbi:MAG TPA: phosphotransferase, partial [Cellulomonas sp.]